MKSLLLFLLNLVFAVNIIAQTCPGTIRVGSSCSCHSCAGTIDVLSYETYVKRVLPQEWLNGWGAQANGMHALQAGAVAIRSYTIPRIAATISSHGNGTYDICNNTCCHAYGTTQFTNSNNAVDNVASIVLVNGSVIQLSEYAAEHNNSPSCGNGMKGNGTTAWPCSADGPCSGQSYNGHGRGMCQNGSARWATGLNLVNSTTTWLSAHGYGTKTWQQILAHYYPNWTLTTCGVVSAPTNDNCPGTLLTSSALCNYLPNQTVNNATASGIAKGTCDVYVSPDLADVWYSFVAQATSHTITVDPNGSALDAVIVAYSSCGGSQVGCSDTQGGNGALSTLVLNGLTVGATYRVRVYDYGLQTTNGGFRICVTGGGSTCPDPTITSLTFDPPNPSVGQDVDFDIEIANVGTASTVASDDPRIEYWVNGMYTGEDDDETTVLGPGDSDTETLNNYVFSAPGTYTVCAILDPYPNECPTNNNTLCQQITVTTGPANCTSPQLTPSSVTHSPLAFSTTPNADDVIVDAQPLCEYAITGSCVSSGWFTLDGATSGTANGVGQFFINYSLDDNTSTSPRSCSLNINGAIFTVTQNGCVSEFDAPTSATVPASGGNGDFDVDSYAPCSWSLSYSCPWVSLSSTSGSGDATVSFTAQPNPGQTQRTCVIAITGGDTFTITQPGCTPPNVVPGSYGPQCSNDPPITLAGSPTGGTWGGAGVNGNQFNPSAGTQTLTYTVTQNGCTGSAQTTIVVNNTITWYADLDGDGDGDPNSSMEACTQPAGYVSTNTDPCPTLANTEPGDACDDGNACTTNDLINGSCGCVGAPVGDADGDGLCDVIDPCPMLANLEPGDACDDGNACTSNDLINGSCGCTGTPVGDADGDGLCDLIDPCPAQPNVEPGGICDDDDACTTDDTWSSGCECVGNPLSMPDSPTGINGPVAAGTGGIHTFTTNSVMDATSYEWNALAADWVGSSTSTSIDYTIGTVPAQVCVRALNSGCYGDSICVWVYDITTGLSALSGTSGWFSISPNPSNGTFQVTPNGLITRAIDIGIFDALGQQVAAPVILSGTQPLRLDLHEKANGIYFLRATRGGESQVLELMIQR